MHTRSRAPPSPRVLAECGPAAGPGTCPPLALPRLRPARSPPQPLGNPRHPDNLPAVAQLVSAAKAPARRPGEVSFLRVPGNPAYTLRNRCARVSVSLLGPDLISTLPVCLSCAGGDVEGAPVDLRTLGGHSCALPVGTHHLATLVPWPQ